MSAADFATMLLSTANSALPYIGYGVAAGALILGVLLGVRALFRMFRVFAEDRERLADWEVYEARYEETYGVMIAAGWSEDDADHIADEDATQWSEAR